MELYAQVEALDPALAERFVFMTGGAFTDAARALVADGPRPVLPKPPDLAALRQHRHLRASLALLEHQAYALVKDHGPRFPTVRTLANGIGEIAAHMLPHLDREEDELFPALLDHAITAELRAKLGAMFDEHREFTHQFRRLRTATNDYQAPAGASDEVVELYAAVHEFEILVARHHHVENHVLLPRFR